MSLIVTPDKRSAILNVTMNDIERSGRLSALQQCLIKKMFDNEEATMKKLAILALLGLLSTSQSTIAEIEEIVVTAQKRAESVQDVPISITALSGDELNQRGLTDMTSVARYVPNFDMTTSTTTRNMRVRIRGIGSPGTNSGIEASVGSFLDGLYMPSGAMSFGELADINTIEILRGPQGTLYGRNTPIGAINVTTKKPSSEYESLIRAGYADYNEKSLNGYVGGGISDNTAGRLSFWYRDRDGYEENALNGNDVNDNGQWGLRGKLLFTPSDDVEINTALYYSEIRKTCCMAEQLAVTDPNWGIATAGFLAAQAAAGYPFNNFDDNDHRLDGDDEGDDTVDSFGASVQVDWSLGDDLLLTSISGYQDWETAVVGSADALKNPVLESKQAQTYKVLSQEFRITSPAGRPVEYMAGLFLYAEDTNFASRLTTLVGANRVFPAPASVCGTPCIAKPGARGFSKFDQETRSVALFGSMTWHMTDVWNVTGGLRWSRDEKEVEIAHTNAAGNGFVFDRLLFKPNPSRKLDRSESKVTWSVNTRYNVSDDVMLFATAATGFKSGGFNALRVPVGQPVEFANESSITYETGVKSFFFDRQVLLNLTLFNTTVDDLQESTLGPSGVGFIVGNAGEQEVKGIEADFTISPNDNLLINGSFAYLDSEYTDFDNAKCIDGQAPTNANGTCNLTGTRPDRSGAKYQYTLGAMWTQPISNSDMEWFARADYAWRDDESLRAISNSDIGIQKAYGTLDLRAGIGEVSGRWQVEAFVRNATDEVYFSWKTNQPAGGLISGGGRSGATGYVGWYGAPRVWGMQFTYQTGQ